MSEVKQYTVLLLRPDTIASDFGQDTYLSWVESANGPVGAIKAARDEVCRVDDYEGDLDDYYTLACFEGYHNDLAVN